MEPERPSTHRFSNLARGSYWPRADELLASLSKRGVAEANTADWRPGLLSELVPALDR